MRPNLSALVLFITVSFLAACNTAGTPGGVSAVGSGSTSLETEDDKILYTLGQVLGQNITEAGLTEDEISPVLAGLSDSALGREPQVDIDQYGSVLNIFMQQRILAAADVELTEAEAFLDQEAALPGTTRTESGIVIQEIEAGTGATPTADDTVTVHYQGSLRNGTVFDSSVERGEPATFPLGQVIPCWTEAVQMMQVGGKSRLVCPPDLAYGPAGQPGIPGNSALVFEVELLGIEE